ncbi:VOC family protein [Paraburkholderia sp. J12]|uniref:VOC family protein n=1 Tax=Paraburkholderia sp. J12 TaxID=2805432 RepID=UPI002ABDE5AC|nr:VOC family protein [Paraburkholderia sp. J12]
MAIKGLDLVTFGVDDLDAAERFLSQWGLQKAVAGSAAGHYVCADGSGVRFAPSDEPWLPPAAQAGPTVREIMWGVESVADLDRLNDELSKDRAVAVDKEGVLRTIDPSGFALAFRVSVKVPLQADPLRFNTPGDPQRVNSPSRFYKSAQPQELSHIVLGVEDFAAAEHFYRQRLGFTVSDRYEGRGVFLRGALRGNHHHLFLLDDGKVSFNHLAFKVRDIHEMIGGGQHFRSLGWETHIGPGRHYASSGCFWYFKSPFGGALEYVADEDILTEAWQASTFTPTPEMFSEWHFAAPAPQLGPLAKPENPS